MPGSMTGTQLTVRIKQHYPRITVIIASAYFNAAERPAPVLTKPYDLFQTASDLAAMAITNRHKE